MYDDLFAHLDQEIRKASNGIKKLDSKLNSTKKQMNVVSKQDNLPKTYKHVEKQSPAFPFCKSQRFFAKKDQAFDETQASFASFSTNPSIDSIKAKGPSIVFAKSERFVDQSSNLDEESTEINPNYDVNKRKAPTLAIYKQPTIKPMSEFMNKSNAINNDHNDDDEKIGPGPAEYQIKFDLIEKKTNGGIFYKADRFKLDEKDEMEDINPNYDAVK